MFNNIFNVIIERLKEPTTWLGIGSIVTAVGFNVAPELWTQITAVGIGVGGLLAVILKERAS